MLAVEHAGHQHYFIFLALYNYGASSGKIAFVPADGTKPQLNGRIRTTSGGLARHRL